MFTALWQSFKNQSLFSTTGWKDLAFLQCSQYRTQYLPMLWDPLILGFWLLGFLLQNPTLYSKFKTVILDSCSWCLLYIILLMVSS